MGAVKQIDIKNRTYYFYNDMIDIKNFDPILLKIDRKSYANVGIYNTGYITIKKIDDYENICSVNPLYLIIAHANGYIEEKGTNKYLIFDSTDENKELLKKYNDVWNGIKDKIKEVNSDECDYEKYYMKIKFNSDDDLPLDKLLKFHNMTIIIRFVFEEDGKLYLQLFLDNTFYELNIFKMLEYDRIDISEGVDVNKTSLSKDVIFVTIGILKILALNMSPIFAMVVMI